MIYPEGAEVITEIVDSYLNDNEFAEQYERFGASAFAVVEDEIRKTLDPDAVPAMYASDTYYSMYNIPMIKLQTGYNDGASAAVLMALYSCGRYDFYKDVSSNVSLQNTLISEMKWDSGKKTTIGEITRTLRRYYSSSNGTYQTKRASSYSDVYMSLVNSLYINAAPVIRIPNGSSYYYAVVSRITDGEDDEYIYIIDPRTGTTKSYTR